MKLDILAFGAHPDDVELSCGGTIAKYLSRGKKVGIVDLTTGQMGTRGTPEIRLSEAVQSSKIFGLTSRENLGFEDIYFQNDIEHQMHVVRMIRKYQPEIVLANSLKDRHPDHPKAAAMVKDSIFLSGLPKIETMSDGSSQKPWRPNAVYFYIQGSPVEPDFIEDVSNYWDIKLKAIRCFKSQFNNPDSSEPETFISSPEFHEMLEGRGKVFGHSIGAKYGEGFVSNRRIGVADMFSLI